jgi:hypothetical protein
MTLQRGYALPKISPFEAGLIGSAVIEVSLVSHDLIDDQVRVS